MKERMKKIGVIAIAFAMILSVLPLAKNNVAFAKLDKSKSVVAAKAKNGLFKEKGKYVLYKNGKKQKGLQKYKGSYYFFSKKGYMEKDIAKTIKGNTYYFQKNGKRYEYAYKSTGSAMGNKAVGRYFAGAKLNSKMDREEALKTFYKYVYQTAKYEPTEKPDFDNDPKWISKFALKFTDSKSGKCYGFGAITYLGALALDYKADLFCDTREITEDGKTRKLGEHCSVVFADKLFSKYEDAYLLDTMDEYLAFKKSGNDKNAPMKMFKLRPENAEVDSFGNVWSFEIKVDENTKYKYNIRAFSTRPVLFSSPKQKNMPKEQSSVTFATAKVANSGVLVKDGNKYYIKKGNTKKSVKNTVINVGKKIYYFNKSGKNVKGAFLLNKKVYGFTSKDPVGYYMTKSDFDKVSKMLYEGKKVKPLIKMLGRPERTVQNDSCYDPRRTGKDVTYYYRGVLIKAFAPNSGEATFIKVESRGTKSAKKTDVNSAKVK